MRPITLFFLLLLSAQASAQLLSWSFPCSDKNFCLDQNSCTQGTVMMTAEATTFCSSPIVNYSYKIDLSSNGSIDQQASGSTVSGTFPAGSHRVTWKATDNCGNVITCSHQFFVKDCSPPNLLCINGLTQQLEPPDCQVSFAASSFILTLTDNCTPNNQLQIGIRKAGSGTGFPTADTMTYLKCDKGTNFVEIVARDAAGLMNTCNSYVLVQDGDSDCVCNQDGDLDFRGCVRKGDGLKLNNFQLRTRVVSTSGVTPTVNKYRVNNYQDSCYSSITEKLPFGGNYLATVQAVKLDYPLNGVSTFDLVLISKHILGIESFTSAYQALAADVNRSSSVTTFDIVETRKLLLGIYDTFPAVPSWRVIRPLANPASLLSFSSTLDTYQIVLPNLQDDHVLPGLNFVAVKSGDVNFSADVSTLQPNDDDRSEVKPPLHLRFDHPRLRAGEEALVGVSLDAAVQTEGWQMSLGFDLSRLQCVGVTGLPAEQYRFTENGQLRLLDVQPAGQTLLAGTPLFFLKLRATHDTELSQSLFLDAALKPELYEKGAGRRVLEMGKNAYDETR